MLQIYIHAERAYESIVDIIKEYDSHIRHDDDNSAYVDVRTNKQTEELWKQLELDLRAIDFGCEWEANVILSTRQQMDYTWCHERWKLARPGVTLFESEITEFFDFKSEATAQLLEERLRQNSYDMVRAMAFRSLVVHA